MRNSVTLQPTRHVTKNKHEAYVILLTSHENTNDTKNGYFLSARVTVHRLKTNPETKISAERDIVVLVTPTISLTMQKILQLDGAMVKVVSTIRPRAFKNNDRWIDCFTKLHIWRLVEYRTIFYLDSDVFVLRSLEDVFELGKADDFELLAPADRNGAHDTDMTTFNAGIMLVRPSLRLFRLFCILAEFTSLYDSGMMEQGLLNWYYRDMKERLPREYSGNFVQQDWKIIDSQHFMKNIFT